MRVTTMKRLLAAPIGMILLLSLATSASAHEHREVGEYELTVGFLNEPALINEPNGLSLAVQLGHGDDGTPVEGLQETLQAEATYAGETMELELRPQFGRPGAYTADLFPTAEGAYSFRIFGTIEGMEIDESFTSGPDTFSEVEGVGAIAFPAGDGDTAAGDTSAASEAQDTADSARTLAIVGIVAGLLGLVAGAAGVLMGINARSARPAETTVVRETGD